MISAFPPEDAPNQRKMNMSAQNQELIFKLKGQLDSSYDKSISAASQKMSELSRGAKDVSQSFSDAEKGGRDFGSGSADAVSDLESALAAAGIAVFLKETASAFLECAEAAEQYEYALAKISTIADTTKVSMETVNTDIFSLSQETGQSVGDLSESVYQAMSASVDSADAVSFVADANKLAVGGFTDTTTAVDVLTTALNAYGLETSKAGEISDMLITTQKLGKTTVGELGQNLGSVIPTAAAFNVNMANISSAMVGMTKQGINTANASTYLRAMLNELGKEGSDVSNVIREETGKSFSDLMSEGKTLGDVIGILSDSVDGDSTAFYNLFGNMRAGQGALTIFNAGVNEFNGTIGEMENSLGATSKAYAKMEDTAEHAHKVFTNTADNLKIAIGESLSPMITGLYETGSDILKGITDFVKANPKLVGAVAAGASAVAVFAGGLVVYTIGAKAATAATAALTAAMDTNPIFLAITAIAALTVGAVALASAMDDSAEKGNQLTIESQKQQDEIDRLKQKHAEAVEQFGEEHEKAKDLQDQIDDLTESFEENKRTYGDMLSEQSEISKKYDELKSEDQSKDLDKEARSAQRAVDKLFALANQTNLTAEQQEEMKAIIAGLNSEYEGLNLTFDDVISDAPNAQKALENYLNAMYKEEQYENAQKQWVNTKELLAQQQEQIEKMTPEVIKASEAYNEALSKKDSTIFDQTEPYMKMQEFWASEREYINAAGETVKGTMREAWDEAHKNVEDMQTDLNKHMQTMKDIAGATDQAKESEIKWEEAASQAIQGIQGELDNLAAAYDKAFEDAQKSIQNTVGLTTELTNETKITTGKLTETWEKQIDWINKYSENLKKAQEYGITDGLIQSLSNGSEESGQYINQIITELDNLNKEDAQALVDKLNEDFSGVQAAEGTFAKTVADYQTDFSKQMGEMQRTAEETVNAMNLSKEAKESAAKTIQAYISEINAQISGESFPNVTASVKSAIQSALTPQGVLAYAKASPFAVEANAKGTKRSADVFLAGEDGPELIVNAGGSQVFTAAETQRILSGDADGDNTTGLTFDIPELLSQLIDYSRAERPTLEDMANDLEEAGNSYNSSYGANQTINYSPSFHIEGSAPSEIVEKVRGAEKISKSEFAKLMREYQLDQNRIKF